MPEPVVVGATVLAAAVLDKGLEETASFTSWPSSPVGDRYAAVVGIFNDGTEFSLFLSAGILVETTALLLSRGWSQVDVGLYISLLNQIAAASGGGVSVLPIDESLLDLARHVRARIIVTDATALLMQTSIDGIVPLDPGAFITKTESIRREARRLRFEQRRQQSSQ